MSLQKIKIEVDVPEGWEVVNYGTAFLGDNFMSLSGKVKTWIASDYSRQKYVILRKIELKGWAWLETLPTPALIKHNSRHLLLERMVSGRLTLSDYRGTYSSSKSDYIGSITPSTCEILYKGEPYEANT